MFKIEIIQPLLHMAAGTSNTAPVAESVTNNEGMVMCICVLRGLTLMYVKIPESLFGEFFHKRKLYNKNMLFH